jgi:simple sugar transport system substrate-binding protein
VTQAIPRRSRARSLLLGALCLSVSAVSFSAPKATAADADRKLRIVFVTSAGPGNPFYGPIIKGFDIAGKQLGVETVFRGDQQTNLLAAAPAVKRMLEDAIATKPDGMVISDTYPEALNDTIKEAVAAGIPVVLSNGGYGEAKNTGALAFVGTDERQLGRIGGERLRDAGAKNILVVTVPPGIPLVDLRIEGVTAGAAPAKITKVQVPIETLGDATKLVNTMFAAIQKDPTIDGVFSIGSCCGPAMVSLKDQLGERANGMHFGTIDLGGPVLQALKDGQIDFGIDQQQFLEGYMPVVMLTNYLRYAIAPASDFVPTGPGIVTKQEAEKVIGLTAENYR